MQQHAGTAPLHGARHLRDRGGVTAEDHHPEVLEEIGGLGDEVVEQRGGDHEHGDAVFRDGVAQLGG